MVPPAAFQGIHTKTMYIDMSYNNIHDIHDDAFHGVQTAVTILKLNNNGLRILPDALADLTNLVDLEIQNNPIKTFSDVVMSSLGPHLEIMTMGSGEMTEWPKEFEHLTNLNTLKVYNLAVNDLPDDAFDGSADTLKNLQIVNTLLSQVPYAICNLSNIEGFQFNNNKNLNESDAILPNCSSPLITVTSAGFVGNDLTDLPDILNDFPNLMTLYVVGNKNLIAVNWKTILPNTRLSNLYLYNNGFRGFPSNLDYIQTLKYLDLHDNNITMVHKFDVIGLTNLLRLNLNGNPLRFIELDALQNLPSLLYLSLDKTNIKTIPQAITFSTSIITISLKSDDIHCTCDALTWLQFWKRRKNVNYIGNCGHLDYQQSIHDYVTLLLPTC